VNHLHDFTTSLGYVISITKLSLRGTASPETPDAAGKRFHPIQVIGGTFPDRRLTQEFDAPIFSYSAYNSIR